MRCPLVGAFFDFLLFSSSLSQLGSVFPSNDVRKHFWTINIISMSLRNNTTWYDLTDQWFNNPLFCFFFILLIKVRILPPWIEVVPEIIKAIHLFNGRPLITEQWDVCLQRPPRVSLEDTRENGKEILPENKCKLFNPKDVGKGYIGRNGWLGRECGKISYWKWKVWQLWWDKVG